MSAQHPNILEGRAVVVGATGGIGSALADALTRQGHETVLGLSRSSYPRLDWENPVSIAEVAATIIDGPPITRLFIATGLLSDGQNGPEKGLKSLDANWLARQFQINAIGPALLLGRLLPNLPRDRRVEVAVLGARVGSISDNRLGGWYGYRSSKAALHQLVRTASIEWGRTHKDGVLAALHPGTVRTPLSAPFTRGGTDHPLLEPAESANHLLRVLASLSPDHSGRIFDWQGHEIQP